MYATGQLFSSGSTGNYELSNDIIGQIKDAIMSSGKASIISDNNPAPSIARSLIIQINNSKHYIHFVSNTGGAINVSVMKLGGLSDFIAYNLGNLSNVYWKMIYGANNFVFTIGTTCIIISINLSNNEKGIGLNNQLVTPSIYLDRDDNQYSLYGVAHGFSSATGYTLDNLLILLPGLLYSGINSNALKDLPFTYGCKSSALSIGNYYKDSNNVYYCFLDRNNLIPAI